MPGNTRILRERMAATQDALDGSLDQTPPDASAAILVSTTTETTYPTTANVFYACTVMGIDSDETEGAAAGYVPIGSDIVYVYNAGSTVIPEGTVVVAHAVGGRWVTRYD